jgi:molybdopterin-containing oxidoreductase family iron-sulfur binding subunit
MSLVQPLIEPLYEGRTPCELLALLCDDERQRGYDITRRTFGILHDAGQDRAGLWKQALHDGVVAGTAFEVLSGLSCERRDEVAEGRAPGWEVAFVPDYALYDGRFANNAWLQEWPDPITKLTWDNAALVSPADARQLGLAGDGGMLELRQGVYTLSIPAYVLPGHAEGSITVPLGYGRGEAAGMVGAEVGFDAYRLRARASMGFATGVEVTATGERHALVTTQDHHAVRSAVGDAEKPGRVAMLAREGTVAHYRAHPHFAQHAVHHPPLASLWQERVYADHKWGMAIDLSACIGCGACVLACQAENNVPVVGKAEVAVGREMHWIRVDRYFAEAAGDQAAVQLVHQPLACVQCELAPCEQVCPVAATVHDTEGLNNMVYNRCIGTRYCSNNCPYKVRRFNWFYNHHGPYHPRSQRAEETVRKDGVNLIPGEQRKAPLTEIEKLANNPDVTVRSRGVMEKCTFCVQRISRVKIKAKNEGWASIPDGLIQPACAQACPAGAIVFGDLNDPDSAVSRLHAGDRAYALLGELNVKPRTVYLAKLRNPVSEPAADQPAGMDHDSGHG